MSEKINVGNVESEGNLESEKNKLLEKMTTLQVPQDLQDKMLELVEKHKYGELISDVGSITLSSGRGAHGSRSRGVMLNNPRVSTHEFDQVNVIMRSGEWELSQW